MYALCMSISSLFSFGMKLGVRYLINSGLHCSLRVSLILFYFISTRAWVENLHIKNCIKNFTVVMPSYFYKDNKCNTSLKRPFSNMQTSQYPPQYCCLHCIKVRDMLRDTVRSGVNPKWI